MRADIGMWLEDAHYDMDCARDLLAARRYNYVVWLARQAVEKALKAACMQVTGRPVPMAHNLIALATTVSSDIPPSVARSLSFLNPHDTMTRYVDAAVGKPSEIFDRQFAEEALKRAHEALEWIESSFLTT